MNSYRLTSMEEPTDQMLATLMKEVVEEAKRSWFTSWSNGTSWRVYQPLPCHRLQSKRDDVLR